VHAPMSPFPLPNQDETSAGTLQLTKEAKARQTHILFAFSFFFVFISYVVSDIVLLSCESDSRLQRSLVGSRGDPKLRDQSQPKPSGMLVFQPFQLESAPA
jgi:hypothetical protein